MLSHSDHQSSTYRVSKPGAGRGWARRPLALALMLLTLAACGAAPQGAPTAQPPAPQGTAPAAAQVASGDPASYCAAVGTIDQPDARYTGPTMPDAIVQAMVRQSLVSADAPPAIQSAATWRCMDGHVWVCLYGANIPCDAKADTSQAPTTAMEDFCRGQPAGSPIPAAVTGHSTVYEWQCSDGKPVAARQVLSVDKQGYQTEFWHELALP